MTQESQTGQSSIRPLMPHEYELFWQIMQEPLTAGEVGYMVGRSRGNPNGWTAQATAPRLRVLLVRGWLCRDGHGIYRATKRGREAVSW